MAMLLLVLWLLLLFCSFLLLFSSLTVCVCKRGPTAAPNRGRPGWREWISRSTRMEVCEHTVSKLDSKCWLRFLQIPVYLGWDMGKGNGSCQHFSFLRNFPRISTPPEHAVRLLNKSLCFIPEPFSSCCFYAVSLQALCCAISWKAWTQCPLAFLVPPEQSLLVLKVLGVQQPPSYFKKPWNLAPLIFKV